MQMCSLARISTDPECFVRGGSNSDNVVFLVDEGSREDKNNTKSRPSSADNAPTLNAGYQ